MAHTYADEKHLISRELFKEKIDQVIANLEAAKLPKVTDADNGKALVVDNGEWAPGSAGTTVVANPTLAGTEAALEGLQVGDTKYKVYNGISEEIDCSVTVNESYLMTYSCRSHKTFESSAAAIDYVKELAAAVLNGVNVAFKTTITQSTIPAFAVGTKFYIRPETVLIQENSFILKVGIYAPKNGTMTSWDYIYGNIDGTTTVGGEYVYVFALEMQLTP